MDWFALTTEVLEKKRQENVEEQKTQMTPPTNGVLDDFEKVEGKLTPLEAAALSWILETASLQIFIIDVGTCTSDPDCSNPIARKKIMEVLQNTKKEIRKKRTFDALYEATKEEIEADKAAKLLTESVMYNKFRIEDLKSKLRGQEYSKITEMNEKQEIIASLKDKIHEEIAKNDVKLRYIDRWETARQNQNRMRCQIAEVELEEKLEEITNKLNNEIRVHDEICKFLSLEELALNKELEKWKVKYEEEMKRRTEKIKQLEKRRKEQQILLHELTELYEEHKREINEYLDLKEQIHKEQERQKFLNEMATKIQAWWRGTMVRRGLGSFKKKKKPGKDKKK